MPSKIYPMKYEVKMSKYVHENLEKIKHQMGMNDEQVIRYLINKEVSETIYGSKIKHQLNES